MSLRQLCLFSSVCMQLGLSKRLTSQLRNDLSQWLATNGVGWTVARLKTYRSAYLAYINYQVYELPWIAHRMQDGFRVPKGPWGQLWQRGGSAEQSRTLKVLHAYSLFIEKQVTPVQKKKFLDSVWAVPTHPGDETYQELWEATRSMLAQVSNPKRMETWDSHARHQWYANLIQRHRRKFSTDFVDFLNLWSNGLIPFALVAKLLADRDDHPLKTLILEADLIKPDKKFKLFGKLGWTQEAGAKLRVFAIPNLVLQYFLEPLKRELMLRLSEIPQDCTFDQVEGASWVRDKISTGHRVWSVDLSNATDRFPLSLQLGIAPLLTSLSDEMELFHSVSRGAYESSELSGGSYVRWMEGQPLGSGPSFPLFALTHHAVVWASGRRARVDVRDNYRIVGDDIVITDKRLYQAYRSMLRELDVPISEGKTLESSRRVAEFVGHTVFQDGVILPSTKWMKEIHPGNTHHWSDVFRHRPPSSLTRKFRMAYSLWYVLFKSNHLGWTRDRRSELIAQYYIDLEDRRRERLIELERWTNKSLFYHLLKTGRVKPADQAGLNVDRDYTVNSVLSKSIPVESLTQGDKWNYHSKNVSPAHHALSKNFTHGEVVALWKSVSELLTDDEKRTLRSLAA